jgi:hypothetical protein
MIIKKLNAVFHRHSRVLFGAFTIVIIVSFLGFLTPGTFGFGSCSGPEGIKMGTAYGEDVTYGELREAARHIAIYNEAFYGVSMSRDLPDEQLFGFCCALRKAKQLGLVASDKEVAEHISKAPALSTNGKFDAKKYDALVANVKRSGMSVKDLDAAFATQVILNKLQRELSSGVIATANEAEQFYRALNTTYSVKVLDFKANFKGKVAQDGNKLKKFFETNKANYTIEGKVSALLVKFPYSAFRVAAKKQVTQAALLNLYNKEEAAFLGKDGKKEPFAKVKAKVAERFIEKAMRDLAARRAYEFATKAYESISGADKAVWSKNFREVADQDKLAVIEGKAVPFSSGVIGGINSYELVRQLAALTSGVPVTNVVQCDDAAVVGMVTSRQETRPAKMDEVSKQVLADWVKDENIKATRQMAKATFDSLNKLSGAALTKAVSQVKGAKVSEFSFNLKTQTLKPEEMMAAQAVLKLLPGKVAPKVDTADGAQIVMLVKRTAPNMKDFAKEKELYISMVRQQKLSNAMMALNEDIAANCRFEAPKQQ